MSLLSPGFVRQKLSSVKSACPKGIYVAPVPDESLRWTGVMFVRKGPYANAILRFQIAFPDNFPARPPVLTFQSDVFHPLVTPLTTYTYSTRDSGAETVSAADEQRLPPGGLSLRHGFPDWFPPTDLSAHVRAGPAAPTEGQNVRSNDDSVAASPLEPGASNISPSPTPLTLSSPPQSPTASYRLTSLVEQPPHIVEVLQYLRIIFDTESVLDTVPLDVAANQGAWHAWRSFRMKSPIVRPTFGTRLPPHTSRSSVSDRSGSIGERSPSPLQQPGGARRPGEWNWQGVWEDRVRKSIQASISDPVLFGGEGGDVIGFVKFDPETLDDLTPWKQQEMADFVAHS